MLRLKDQCYKITNHPEGSKIVRQFLEFLPGFRDKFLTYIYENFDEIREGKYSVLILLKLIVMQNRKFVRFMKKILRKDPRVLISDRSGALLLSELVLAVDDPEIAETLIKTAKEFPNMLKRSTFIDILASLAEVCEPVICQQVLEIVEEQLQVVLSTGSGYFLFEKLFLKGYDHFGVRI